MPPLHPARFADTAGAYRYKIYKFGTDHTVSDNVVHTSDRVEMEPWISASTTFETPDLSPGLYSVWVQAEHKDYDPNNDDTRTLFTTATSPVGTSYAIGEQGSSGWPVCKLSVSWQRACVPAAIACSWPCSAAPIWVPHTECTN